MVTTVQRLVDRADLGLRVVVEGQPGALGRPIVWAHSTELEDPTPFLEGGELILTTGIVLPRDGHGSTAPPGERLSLDLVARLVGVGVCGLGFGTGLRHAEVPRALVEAAERHRLPLFEVPRQTPFIAVTKAISRALMDDEFARLNGGYHSQRRLIAAAGAQDPTRAVVLRTAELIGGWTALLDPSGAIVEMSHLSVTRLVRLSADMRSSRPGEATFTTTGGIDVASYPIFAPNGRHLGHLVAGRRGETGTLDHGSVAVATTLLALSMNRTDHADRVIRQVRAVLIRQLLVSGPPSVAALARDAWGGLPEEPIHLIRTTGPPSARTAVHGALEPFDKPRTRRGPGTAFGDLDDEVWIAVHTAHQERLVDRLAAIDGLTLGVSSAAWWDETSRARREATAAVDIANTRGRTAVRFGEAGELSIFGLLEGARARAFADTQLEPLLAGPPSTARPALLDTLTCWLKNNGHQDSTAAELGIHRHTLRKRLTRIEELLGRPLDSADVRTELWFACRVHQQG